MKVWKVVSQKPLSGKQTQPKTSHFPKVSIPLSLFSSTPFHFLSQIYDHNLKLTIKVAMLHLFPSL